MAISRRCILVATLVGLPVVCGRSQGIDFDALIQGAEAWAAENLDESFLESLSQIDTGQIREFLEDVERRLHGEYALDLAALREGAKSILPLLESHEETEPYAAWLKTRLDYSDVAEEFKRTLPPPKPEPGKAATPPVPTPEQQRKAWVKEITIRPVPPPVKEDPQIKALKSIFKAERVPPEMAWLAEVESSFNPKAKSPVGAAGLYQLMPATAKQYGLSLWPRDERLQPDKNARASARYLRALHGRFKDWPLALAAYNAGEGTVQKQLRRSQIKSFDSIASRLPAETQMYVPKVNATLLKRENIALTRLAAPT